MSCEAIYLKMKLHGLGYSHRSEVSVSGLSSWRKVCGEKVLDMYWFHDERGKYHVQ